jgi:hypothetical protein
MSICFHNVFVGLQGLLRDDVEVIALLVYHHSDVVDDVVDPHSVLFDLVEQRSLLFSNFVLYFVVDLQFAFLVHLLLVP